jgi:hypothetical protein
MVNQRRHIRQSCDEAVRISFCDQSFVIATLADFSRSGSFILLPAGQHDALPLGCVVAVYSDALASDDRAINFIVVRHNEAGVGLVRPEHQIIH